VTYIRKDRRIEKFSVSSDSKTTAVLNCSGLEPLMIYVTGNDVQIGYEPGGPYMTLPEGYQYTWENKHPFGAEVYFAVTGTDAVVTFMIGGSVQ
jgi:hypothetical protein